MTDNTTQATDGGSELTESAISNHLRSRPATVRRIAGFLFNRYGNQVDLSDIETRPLVERIESFLTRALAAHAVVSYTMLDAADAAKCVVDGGQDLGIDAIAFDESLKRCWLIQAKFVQGGQGLIGWQDLSRFLDGFESIISDTFDHANRKILAMKDEISRAATEVAWKFTLVLGSTSTNPVSDHNLTRIHEKLEYQDPGNMGTFTFDNFHLNKVTASVEQSIAPTAIDLDIELSDWGCVTEPFVAYYGHIPLSTVVYWRQHGTALFDKNLRGFLGDSPVTTSIGDTLRDESQVFWYLNNGATLLCESIKRSGPYSAAKSRETGFFHCKGVSVVNGAQTIGTVWERAGDGASLDPLARVHIRLISLEDSQEDFGAKVTRATNTQKNILARDFATLDAAQRSLQRQFALDGLTYVFRTGISPPGPNEGCTLEEVSIALACERSVADSVVAYRNPGYLTDPGNSHYKAIFHGDQELRSEDAWRAVRIYRASVEVLSAERASVSGRQAQVATHGARYITHRVFTDPRIKGIRGEWSAAKSQTIAAVTRKHLQLVAEYLNNISGYLQVLFKNTDRVTALDNELQSATSSVTDAPAKNGYLFDPDNPP